MGTKSDVFINQQALYEQVGGILENLDTDIFIMLSSIKRNADKEWTPEEIKSDVNMAICRSKEARNKIQEIHDIFQAEKTKRAKAIVNSSRKRIERLTVLKGGLYKPPQKTKTFTADDLISDEFKKWQKEQNNNPEVTA